MANADIQTARFEIRMTEKERKAIRKAARRDGYSSQSEWARVVLARAARGDDASKGDQ